MADKKDDDAPRTAPDGLVKARQLLARITAAGGDPGADTAVFNDLHVRAQELVTELDK